MASLFAEKNNSNERRSYSKTSFYFLLGPVLFLICLALFAIKASVSQAVFSVALAASLLLFWKREGLGLLLGSLSYLSLFLWKWPDISWWQMGSCLAILLTGYISATGFQEGASLFEKFLQQEKTENLNKQELEKECQERERKLEEMSKGLDRAQEELNIEKKKSEEISFSLQHFVTKDQLSGERIDGLIKQCIKMKDELQEKEAAFVQIKQELEQEKEGRLQDEVLHKQYVQSLKDSLHEKEEAIASLHLSLEEKKRMQDDLNEARVDHFQLSFLLEEQKKKVKIKEDELLGLQEALKEIQTSAFRKEKDLEQLKKQFAEKTATLNNTRKELFQAEGRCIALQKDMEDKDNERNHEEIFLTGHLQKIEEERNELESEVQHLQEIVSRVLSKKKAAPRKSNKAKEKTNPEDLKLNF